MNSLWKIVRGTMAVVGGILVLGAAGTSDYYVLELGQREPDSVWVMLVIGLLMTVPAVIHAIPSKK